MHDKEETYDTLIHPLMAQIIQVCKEHGIPMLAVFQLSDGERPQDLDTGPMVCTTAIPQDWQDERLSRARSIIQPPRRRVTMSRIRTMSGDGEVIADDVVAVLE